MKIILLRPSFSLSCWTRPCVSHECKWRNFALQDFFEIVIICTGSEEAASFVNISFIEVDALGYGGVAFLTTISTFNNINNNGKHKRNKVFEKAQGEMLNFSIWHKSVILFNNVTVKTLVYFEEFKNTVWWK